MNTYVDKTKENKIQSAENSVSQKQIARRSLFQFKDNRPEAIAQRKLQETITNSALITQRKLITKDGEYDSFDKLPKMKKDNMELMVATNTQPTWFVENNKEIQKIGSDQGGQLVGPNVHIIGEDHSKSKWSEVKKKWGYTGKITYEDLSDSETVKSSETAYNLKTDKDRKPENILENLHAKNVVDLAVALYASKRLKAIYNNLMIYIKNKDDVNSAKMKESGSELRAEVTSQLSDFEFYWKNDYVKAGKTAEQKQKDQRTRAEKILILLIDTYAQVIVADIKLLMSNPIGIFTFRSETMIGELDKWINYSDTLSKNINMVIELLHGLIEEETKTADEYGMRLALDEQRNRIKSIDQNTSTQDVLDSASPLRENFMILRLREMGAPSIAVIGNAHKDNLKKNSPIPEDKYYDSYDDFVNKTTSKA